MGCFPRDRIRIRTQEVVVVAAAVRMVRSLRDRTRIRMEGIRRRGQAVAAAVTEVVLPQGAMACLQAPVPEAASPEAAVPPGGRAVRANDDHHNCGNGIEPVIASATAPACASAVGSLA
jgi:hypothetical protein